MTEIETRVVKRGDIIKFNLMLFVSYLGIFATLFLVQSSFGFSLGGLSAYVIHAVILIAISIYKLIRGSVKKVKTNAGEYFLTAIIILIVGFGTCTAVFSIAFKNI